MTTLEILRHARASIADPGERFKFTDWSYCTCGHIYRATTGRYAGADVGPVVRSDEVEERVSDAYRETARVLGLGADEAGPLNTFATAISLATSVRAGDTPVEREHALSLIDEAISALEAEYERNRLDVLAQAQRIVDNAETPEPSLA